MIRAHRELSAGASHGAAHPVAEARKDMAALKQRLIDSELRAVEAKREAAAAVAVREERVSEMRRGTEECADIAAEAISQLASYTGGAPNLQSRLRNAEVNFNLPQHNLDGRQQQPPPGRGAQPDPRSPPLQQQQQQQQRGGEVAPPKTDALSSTMSVLAMLDYSAIKAEMMEGAESVPGLMQALRWRLTKPARRQRKTALVQYIQNDLLDADIIEAVLGGRADVSSHDRATQEQALRLINLFASEPAGRTYLLGQPDLIDRLCQLLVSEPADTVARQNCLGSLQKLSLRRQQQNVMIDADVIAWLVQQLDDVDSLSQYSVEYGTALLMNLSLRTAGKGKCTDPELDILNVLSQLMEHESMQVRTYVNGTLYSVLVKASLKARAAEIGLPDSLKLLIEHSDETFARQINYILEQIDKDASEEEDAQSEDEGPEEEDEEEVEEEEGGEAEEEEVDIFPEADLDLGAVGGIAGEELLCTRYMQTDVAEAQQEAAQLEASMRMDDDRRRAAAADASLRPSEMSARKRHHPDEPLQRPTTPRAPDAPPADYGAVAMQQSGAMPEDKVDDPLEESAELTTGIEEGGVEAPAAASAPSAAYPDPDAIDTTSPTIPVRNRLARTPSRKSRDGPEPTALQPTAPRARATVERVQRRPPGSVAPSPGKPKGGANAPSDATE